MTVVFIFVAADAELCPQDILTCGSCQKSFALGDIVRFIQHKVLVCNKENFVAGPAVEDPRDDGAAPGHLGVVRRPSISAPITRKAATPTRAVCSPPESSPKIGEDEATTSTPKRRSSCSSPLPLPHIKEEADAASCIGSSPDDVKKIRGVDAESNTTHSGRFTLTNMPNALVIIFFLLLSFYSFRQQTRKNMGREIFQGIELDMAPTIPPPVRGG